MSRLGLFGALIALLALATAVSAQNWKPNLPANYYTSFRLRTSLSDELGKGAIFSNTDAGLLRVELMYMNTHVHDTVRNRTLYAVMGRDHASETCRVFSLMVSPTMSWWWTQYLAPQGFDTQHQCWKFGLQIYGASVTTCLRAQSVLTYFKVTVAGKELEMTTNTFWPARPSVSWFPIDEACKSASPTLRPTLPSTILTTLAESKLVGLQESLDKAKDDGVAFSQAILSAFFL